MNDLDHASGFLHWTKVLLRPRGKVGSSGQMLHKRSLQPVLDEQCLSTESMNPGLARCVCALMVTPAEPDANLAITLMAHTINPKLWIAVPGENSLRRVLLESAGASHVVIADDLIAEALVGQLATHAEEAT